MTLSSDASERRNADTKVFLVTGATDAIGKAIARQLAATPDAEVVLVCRNPDKAEQAVRDIAASTGNSRVRHELADLSRQDDIRGLATHPVGQQATGRYYEHQCESPCTFGRDRRAVHALHEICAGYADGRSRR
ncbi:MAG: SDR family NAD(P)-dependent oxidoreductase [Gammaproteobacteria bacterium]